MGKDQQTAFYYWRLSWYDECAKNKPYWTVHATQQKLIEYAREIRKLFILQSLKAFEQRTLPALFRLPWCFGICCQRHCRSARLRCWEMPPIRCHPLSLPGPHSDLTGYRVLTSHIVRGEGGNHALQDGLNLPQCQSRMSSDTTIPDILKLYEEEMLA